MQTAGFWRSGFMGVSLQGLRESQQRQKRLVATLAGSARVLEALYEPVCSVTNLPEFIEKTHGVSRPKRSVVETWLLAIRRLTSRWFSRVRLMSISA